MENLDKIINNTKKKLKSTFFKIEKVGDSFVISEYSGPKKSLFKMHSEGWNYFPSLLNEINESYPIFNLNDFKAIDLNTIVKKTDRDYLEEELKKIIRYLESSDALYNAINNLKTILMNLKIQYMNCANFSEVQNLLANTLNTNTLDGVKYLNIFNTYANNVYLQMENLKISNPRKLFEEKFNYFFALIK